MDIDQIFHDSLKPIGSATGEFSLPCVPALHEYYETHILDVFKLLGITFSAATTDQIREKVAAELEEGFRISQHSRLVVKYKPAQPPRTGCQIEILHTVISVRDYYENIIKNFVGTDIAEPEKAVFGKYPHAKVLDTASQLGNPKLARILDVGAGLGRNAIPLARFGHPVDAVELVDLLFQSLATTAKRESLAINIIEGDILDPLIEFSVGQYQMAILTELFCHFRTPEDVRLALTKVCHAILPGGFILFDIFVTTGDYYPKLAVRQTAQVLQSFLVTPDELKTMLESLPLEVISQESMYEYERDRLPAEAWPPSAWFERWSNGKMVFPTDNPPISLYWILCKRTDGAVGDRTLTSTADA
jgi:2-polyprenyl-3-methyl-5-hydroxy-6-metoxy-1,4-benzoquinol methylase